MLVKFVSYPFEEYGSVEGKIAFVAKVPSRDNSYLIRVSFPNGLVTSYDKTLVYKNGMIADADLITAGSRLFNSYCTISGSFFSGKPGVWYNKAYRSLLLSPVSSVALVI